MCETQDEGTRTRKLRGKNANTIGQSPPIAVNGGILEGGRMATVVVGHGGGKAGVHDRIDYCGGGINRIDVVNYEEDGACAHALSRPLKWLIRQPGTFCFGVGSLVCWFRLPPPSLPFLLVPLCLKWKSNEQKRRCSDAIRAVCSAVCCLCLCHSPLARPRTNAAGLEKADEKICKQHVSKTHLYTLLICSIPSTTTFKRVRRGQCAAAKSIWLAGHDRPTDGNGTYSSTRTCFGDRHPVAAQQ